MTPAPTYTHTHTLLVLVGLLLCAELKPSFCPSNGPWHLVTPQPHGPTMALLLSHSNGLRFPLFAEPAPTLVWKGFFFLNAFHQEIRHPAQIRQSPRRRLERRPGVINEACIGLYFSIGSASLRERFRSLRRAFLSQRAKRSGFKCSSHRFAGTNGGPSKQAYSACI